MRNSFLRVIATLNLFQGKQSLTIFLLAAFFALSACDDSSSASSDETGVSSSSVESPDSSVTLSGASAESNGSSNETKDKLSSSDTKSSSSAKETKNSSDSKSSSSVKSGDSSSSNKDKSSSSVSSSSSIKDGSSSSFDITAPCKYGDVYIEESDGEKKAYICYEDGWKRYIPNSSSSSIAHSSSSRGYEALPSPLRYNLSYGEYEDTRDGTKYATIEITNKYGPDSIPKITFTVFAQNLKYHEKITLGTNEQDDDDKVEMYCYNDSVEYCNDWWGGLYQWAEMMALPYVCNSKSCADQIDPDHDGFHQGICPNGWHLITEKEMLAVSYATGVSGNEYLANSVRSEVSFFIAGGNNQSGMSVIAAGFRKNEKNIVYKAIGEGGYFHYPNESRSGDVKACGAGGVFSDYAYFSTGDQKKYGVSVRCVKNY